MSPFILFYGGEYVKRMEADEGCFLYVVLITHWDLYFCTCMRFVVHNPQFLERFGEDNVVTLYALRRSVLSSFPFVPPYLCPYLP